MKIKRFLAVIVATVMMLSLFNLNVFASDLEPPLPMTRATTDYFYTPAMTAGVWWSGYDSDRIYDLACSKTSLTGSDITVYIYYSQVGMPATFVKDGTRTCTLQVKEDDASAGNANELLFTRTGTFGIDSNGLYNIVSWSSRSDVNFDVVEDNSTLELYIRAYIQTKAGDSGTAVPKDLLCYKFATTY